MTEASLKALGIGSVNEGAVVGGKPHQTKGKELIVKKSPIDGRKTGAVRVAGEQDVDAVIDAAETHSKPGESCRAAAVNSFGIGEKLRGTR